MGFEMGIFNGKWMNLLSGCCSYRGSSCLPDTINTWPGQGHRHSCELDLRTLKWKWLWAWSRDRALYQSSSWGARRDRTKTQAPGALQSMKPTVAAEAWDSRVQICSLSRPHSVRQEHYHWESTPCFQVRSPVPNTVFILALPLLPIFRESNCLTKCTPPRSTWLWHDTRWTPSALIWRHLADCLPSDVHFHLGPVASLADFLLYCKHCLSPFPKLLTSL